MAKIDVKNISGKSVGSIDLDDAVFGAEVHEHLLWEVGEVAAREAPRRHGLDQAHRRGPRLGEEGLEAEGHRPGSPGQPSGAALRRRWLGVRPQAAQLRVQHAAQGEEDRARARRCRSAPREQKLVVLDKLRRPTARPSRSRPRSPLTASAAVEQGPDRRREDNEKLVARRAEPRLDRSGSPPKASTSTTSSATRRWS